jgi:hypothetical protein
MFIPIVTVRALRISEDYDNFEGYEIGCAVCSSLWPRLTLNNTSQNTRMDLHNLQCPGERLVPVEQETS